MNVWFSHSFCMLDSELFTISFCVIGTQLSRDITAYSILNIIIN